MPSLTANALIQESCWLLNLFLPGESVDPTFAEAARTLLNRMLSQWRTRSLLIPVIARERFDLVANQGGPDNPYTIGDGGDFDTERPPTQNSIQSANLILTSTTREVRVPLGIYTDQAYDANQIPDMSNSQPTGLYYNPTYADGFGSIFLWPVPDVSTNDLELFLAKPLVSFANLTTSYDLPDGADDALVYQLALRLAGPNGRTLSDDDQKIARTSLDAFMRANVHLSDQMNDANFAGARRTLYNIQSGSGG